MTEFNEDAYRDGQLNKHLQEQEDNEEVSNCCGEELEYNVDDDSIYYCSKCSNLCSTITRGEYKAEAYESAMEDKADAQREEWR